MAFDDPGPLTGLHLTNLELAPWTGPGSRPLSRAERRFVEQSRRWDETERGYAAIQSTKPQTLNDSPAGQAAWICEKWRSRSDCGGDLEARFTRDFLLTIVTLYWVTGTITSSIRQPPLDRDAPRRMRDQWAGAGAGRERRTCSALA
jgi:hypothetical protein